MINELLLVAAVNYMTSKPFNRPRDEAWIIANAISKSVDFEHEFLLYLAMAQVESGFNLNALNKKSGATGALQVMPMHNPGSGSRAIQRGIEVREAWLRLTGDTKSSLAHYNGGYRAANTEQCKKYATRVFNLYIKLRNSWINGKAL